MSPENLGDAFSGEPNGEEEDNNELFTPGGAATFPFLQNIFGDSLPAGANAAQNANSQKAAEKKAEG